MKISIINLGAFEILSLKLSFLSVIFSLLYFLFQDVFHLKQFVAILCGLKEIEIFGGFLHEAACAFDALLELFGRHVKGNRVGSDEAGCFRLDIGPGSSGRFGRSGGRGGGCQRVELASLLNLLGGDVVFPVVTKLLFAAAFGLFDGLSHAVGDVVGIHDDTPVDVAGCASGRLRDGGNGGTLPCRHQG